MIKSIIFDFDGVIHDTLDIGYHMNKELYPELSLDEYKEIFTGNLYKHKRITPEFEKRFFEMSYEYYKDLKIEKEIKDELIRLKKKFRLFIITSNKESILKRYFSDNNLSELFEDVMGFETHRSKVEKFKLLMNKHNLLKDECAFITDTLGDVLEGNEIGIKTIAVDFGFHSREVLERGNPSSIISNFSDIESTINK